MDFIVQLYNNGVQNISTYPMIYITVIVAVVVAAAFGVGTLIVSYFVRPNKPYAEKNSPYECGSVPIGDARERQIIRFYVIAMLFVLFDVETIFLFPWAVSYGVLGLFGLIEMGIFIVILLLGYVYLWRSKALQWV